MTCLTIYEFDALTTADKIASDSKGVHIVPIKVFDWLREQCLRIADVGNAPWLRWTQRRGHHVIQVTSFVGVIRAPDGFQIEVLPKIGKAMVNSTIEVRQLLIDMLCCLKEFRHIKTDSAKLSATRMPLPEIFISEFLQEVGIIIKHGMRSDYLRRQGNLSALRGKLKLSSHLQQNLFRADRFFTEYDEFINDRPENRLIRSALRQVILLTKTQLNQRLARELDFAFTDIPISTQIKTDIQKIRLDRGMSYYAQALAWACLILNEESPLTGSGQYYAPSLLFPMEAVFEAYVEKHLLMQLEKGFSLKAQARSQYLVQHNNQNWFRLNPDLLVQLKGTTHLVLDTKWKLLDSSKKNGREKYQLSQADFYQLYAYGHHYLDGNGDIILVYPKTDTFNDVLDVFEFPKSKGMRLWVLPFCLKTRKLLVPQSTIIDNYFSIK
ncbi:McrC family protein [Acinetobacter baumannii]|uniref:McrC family protein n=1 Tax=Acinetobacter baumannii TaxID=470 RepID=UPI002447C455|nr:McrC family protein [Acinetobacter baumannii]MDH2604943.1 McrC family protein [Acinetobacter baumannii]